MKPSFFSLPVSLHGRKNPCPSFWHLFRMKACHMKACYMKAWYEDLSITPRAASKVLWITDKYTYLSSYSRRSRCAGSLSQETQALPGHTDWRGLWFSMESPCLSKLKFIKIYVLLFALFRADELRKTCSWTCCQAFMFRFIFHACFSMDMPD
jgi:hypothetical protein